MIKNYTSNSKNTFDAIQKALATHGAKQVFFDYNQNGQVKALAFSLDIQGKLIGFMLPARVENVEKIFAASKKDRWGYQKALDEDDKQQAYRTAWANIRDWLTSQLALIDTEQVKMEEVFLPYMMVSKDVTLFQSMENNGMLLPSGGKS